MSIKTEVKVTVNCDGCSAVIYDSAEPEYADFGVITRASDDLFYPGKNHGVPNQPPTILCPKCYDDALEWLNIAKVSVEGTNIEVIKLPDGYELRPTACSWINDSKCEE